MTSTRRLSFFAPLVILACALAGGIYAPGVAGVSAASGEDDIRAGLRTFSNVYTQVEQNAAERLDPDKAIYSGAIPGLLRTLDPHSSFFDPKDYQQLREAQRGHYFGVGMTVAPKNTCSRFSCCAGSTRTAFGKPGQNDRLLVGYQYTAGGREFTSQMRLPAAQFAGNDNGQPPATFPVFYQPADPVNHVAFDDPRERFWPAAVRLGVAAAVALSGSQSASALPAAASAAMGSAPGPTATTSATPLLAASAPTQRWASGACSPSSRIAPRKATARRPCARASIASVSRAERTESGAAL